MKKVIIFIIVILLGVGAYFGYNYYKHSSNNKMLDLNRKKLLKDIKNNYYKTVITKKETKLYIKNNDRYEKAGTISKDYILSLDKLEEANKYYKIVDSDYYIYYEDVTKHEDEIVINDRFNKFIPFNNNVVVSPNTKIYLDDKLFISLDKEISGPLIVKDTDKYGFKYQDKLFYVSVDGASLIDSENSSERKASKVLTLTYHFIYDPEEKSCNQDICQTLEQFESHLKYLNENNYFILKLSELEMYLDGKVNLPYNSITLTIDDGYISEKAIRLLEQYKTYATLFVITSYFKDFSVFESPYLDLQSHTDTMHEQWECGSMGNQGGGLLCREEEKAINDLKTSQEKLGGSDKVVYLSYPFFDFNDHAINILKQAGFKMAFIGQWNSGGFSTVGTNKYKIPRLTVFSDTSVESLKRSLAY